MPPAVDVDLERVEELAALGHTDHDIAALSGISERTLKRKARAALSRGRARFRDELLRAQHALAKKGNAAMLIHLGKAHLGQKYADEVALPDLRDIKVTVKHTIVDPPTRRAG